MKKLTRNVIIMAVVTVIMAVVLGLYIKYTGTVPAADNAASLTDGIYTSSAQGCLSDVTVTVTVTGGRVTGVVDASGETPELGGIAAGSGRPADQGWFHQRCGRCCRCYHMTNDAVFHRHGRLPEVRQSKTPKDRHGSQLCRPFFLKIQHKEREHYGRIIQSGTN